MKIKTTIDWDTSAKACFGQSIDQIEQQHNEEIEELKYQIADLKMQVSRLSSRLGNRDFTVYR